MITNFISKSLEFIELLICEKIAGVILFKRNEMKNCKCTLTPKMPFAARFWCCATIEFNSILIYFPTRAYARGVGVKTPPLNLLCYKNVITYGKEFVYVFVHFLLV